MTLAGLRILLAAGLALVLPVAAWAQRYDPSLEFRTITTPHFWIHFHQGEDDLAQQVAEMSEAVRARLIVNRPAPEPGKTHVILSGQDDVPNGWATTIPFNVIELRTVVPRPSSALGHTIDWLTFVFSHEYSHILHLDRSFGIMAATRRVFGRVPFAMPNLFLPTWQVEGIATWRESAITGLGRVHDGSARRVLAAAGRAGTFEPLDRLNGGLVTWPAGEGSYFYGALFQAYLADRFGVQALERLTTETARWPPYLGVFAYSRVFGASAGTLWREFATRWTSGVSTASEIDPATRLTSDGFATASPRWDPARSSVLFYVRRTPAAFPAIVEIDLASAATRTVTEKYFGESLSVRGARLLFDEWRLERNAALVNSLHVIDDHRTRNASRSLALTDRIGDADLSPDGQRAVAVVTRPDRRDLVLVNVAAGTSAPPAILSSEAGTYYSGPRWSPDGRRIAAERVRTGMLAQVVMVDAETGLVESLVPRRGERQATPTWTPDGRTVVFAAASGTQPFNLLAVDVSSAEVWRVTSRRDGARAPDVSPDGTRLAFLGYTTRGEDVFVMPLERSTWALAPAPEAAVIPVVSPMTPAGETAPAVPYSPWHGFVPRYWAPELRAGSDETAVGAFTSMADALGRHQASVSASVWSGTHRADWSVSYAYQRFRPSTFLTGSSETERSDDGLLTSRTATAGMVVPFIGVRQSQQVLAAFRFERLTLDVENVGRSSFERHALRAGWWLDTTNTYGYSISAEEGIRAGVATEHARRALGADGRADWIAGELRAYQRVGPPHAVLAARVSALRSSGERGLRRRVFVDEAGPARGVLSFDGDSVIVFRGAGASELSGLRAVGLNLDYRWPVWRIERGAGVYPAFLRWLHASAFVDAADVRDRGRARSPAVAVGVELASDLVFGYALPLTMAGGVSWRVDDGRGADRVHGFVRVGRSF